LFGIVAAQVERVRSCGAMYFVLSVEHGLVSFLGWAWRRTGASGLRLLAARGQQRRGRRRFSWISSKGSIDGR
jgi:hypothetical protein